VSIASPQAKGWNIAAIERLPRGDAGEEIMNRSTFAAAAIAVALTACNKQASNNSANVAAATNAGAEGPAAGNEAMNSGTASTGAIDAAFVTDAMKADNGEVALGNLAQQKGSSTGVKDLGKMLVTDHSAHKQEVAALARKGNVAVTDDLKDEAKAEQTKLQGLSGAAFDKEFVRATVEAHQKDIAKYEQEAKTGDPQTAALANKTLPTLRKHLKAAQALEK
jgi:putative membrane protein